MPLGHATDVSPFCTISFNVSATLKKLQSSSKCRSQGGHIARGNITPSSCKDVFPKEIILIIFSIFCFIFFKPTALATSQEGNIALTWQSSIVMNGCESQFYTIMYVHTQRHPMYLCTHLHKFVCAYECETCNFGYC